ncbi:perlucin-like protein [Crassostrea angulata]|uniref:perlucin-like protein n=1 Tax=Magallana angulata TaxID=2784310 RepID=UPI0022B20376|nr:perlucin-like protein [Crassostrea angulata]
MESGKSQLWFLIIFSLASTAVSRTHCEKGWFPFENHCYKFSSSTATFKDAMIFCNNLGAELLELQSKAEEDWIDLQCRVRGYTDGVWLGLSDVQTEGQFVSLSDARKPQGNFRNWAKGEPNNNGHNEHCAMYWTAITLTTANTVPCIGRQ